MSIEGQLYYRGVYLKSEKWQSVRLEAMVREKGRCQICAEESLTNDAHHIWYPKSIWDTTQENLVILCRPCHDFLHCMMPDCKTNNEQQGRDLWLKFTNAIIVWRRQKISLFSDPTGEFLGPKALRKELERLKAQLANQDFQAHPENEEAEYNYVMDAVKRWGKVHKQYAKSVKSLVEQKER